MPEDKQIEAFTCEVRGVPDETRVLRFMGTTPTRDRMGDEIPLRGWITEPFMKNPVFLWCHDYRQPPIGKAIRIKPMTKNGVRGLVFDVEFASKEDNPFAEQIFNLYRKGFLNAVSVGFRPLKSSYIEEDDDQRQKREKDEPDVQPGRSFETKELLELSGTPVPANPEALLIATKKGMEIPKELKKVLDKFVYERGMEALANVKRIKNMTKAPETEQEEAENQNKETEKEEPIEDASEEEAHEIRETPQDPSEEETSTKEIVTKPGFEDQEGWTEIKYRVRNPGLFQEDSFRRKTMQKSPKIIGIFGRLKGESTMTLQSLRFPKSAGWTVAKAKKWVAEHKDTLKTIAENLEKLELEDEKAFDMLDITIREPDAGKPRDDLDHIAEALQEKQQEFLDRISAILEKRQWVSASFEDAAQPTAEIAETAGEGQAAQPAREIAETASEAGGPEHITRRIYRIVRKKNRPSKEEEQCQTQNWKQRLRLRLRKRKSL